MMPERGGYDKGIRQVNSEIQVYKTISMLHVPHLSIMPSHGVAEKPNGPCVLCMEEREIMLPLWEQYTEGNQTLRAYLDNRCAETVAALSAAITLLLLALETCKAESITQSTDIWVPVTAGLFIRGDNDATPVIDRIAAWDFFQTAHTIMLLQEFKMPRRWHQPLPDL